MLSLTTAVPNNKMFTCVGRPESTEEGVVSNKKELYPVQTHHGFSSHAIFTEVHKNLLLILVLRIF